LRFEDWRLARFGGCNAATRTFTVQEVRFLLSSQNHFAANTVPGSAIRAIRVLKFSYSPRNEPPNPAEYLGERPEMTPHDEEPRKAKTRKGNNTDENKIS